MAYVYSRLMNLFVTSVKNHAWSDDLELVASELARKRVVMFFLGRCATNNRFLTGCQALSY